MTRDIAKKITVVLSLVLPIILLFAILNCFTTYVFYEDYKYKMNLYDKDCCKGRIFRADVVSKLA